jgi:putative acetyltransferase
MGFKLRYSTKDDLAALHALWRRSVEATHDFLSTEHLAIISDIVREIYLPSTSFTVAVDVNDAPIAFLGGDAGTIDALFVDPDWFGKGAGKALLEQALTRAPVVRLDVNEANAQARRFYERMGFRAIGRSELDSSGMPYPLMHMEWRAEAQPK